MFWKYAIDRNWKSTHAWKTLFYTGPLTSSLSARGWEEAGQSQGWASTPRRSCSPELGDRCLVLITVLAPSSPHFPAAEGAVNPLQMLTVKLHFQYKAALLPHGNSEHGLIHAAATQGLQTGNTYWSLIVILQEERKALCVRERGHPRSLWVTSQSLSLILSLSLKFSNPVPLSPPGVLCWPSRLLPQGTSH